MSLTLDFQREIFAELAAEDALLVMARGLGMRSIIASFLHLYAQPQSLVLLLNTSQDEDISLRDELSSTHGSGALFRSINSELNIAERANLYRLGGVMSITSRILVTDMLTNKIPIHLITGVLVANAHRVSATSTEAFILRLYRQGNSEGFIKAFSDQPEALSGGFATLEKSMKSLYLRKVNLWPRFHVTVSNSLEAHKADVVEIRPQMTASMKTIQTAIIDCMDLSIQELRRSSAGIEIELDEFTVERALSKSFDVIIRRQLDPIWHRVSLKTKQLVADLKSLRQLLGYLVSYDSVTFNSYLETLLASNSPTAGSLHFQYLNWIQADPAEKIFRVAKARVFLKQESYIDPDDDTLPPGMRPVLEELPKWNILSEIMDEIEHEIITDPNPEDMDTVLIMVEDSRTCSQLKKYLATEKSQTQTRGKPLMRQLLHRYLLWKSSMSQVRRNLMGGVNSRSSTVNPYIQPRATGSSAPPNKRRRTRGGGNVGSSVIPAEPSKPTFDQEATALAAFLNAHQGEHHFPDLEPADEYDNGETFSDFFGLVEASSLVIVRPFSGDADAKLLQEVKPRFIVMYDPEPSFVRCIEVYKACNPGKQVRVYFTSYEDSVEEQLFLSSMRREKDAFTKLIRDKSIMVLPLGDTQGQQVQNESLLRNIHTRIAGGGRMGQDKPPPKIIVDTREFRSTLPSILHSQGMTIEPRTITIGDYVLSPNICVERKSIPDLIGSFSSGRLYTQVEAMVVNYPIPVLLIEFDQDKSFSLQSSSEMRPDISITELSSKISLLVLSFPTLRLIWSSSVHATAEIFDDLKRSEDEPDGESVQAVGVDPTQEIDSAFNVTPQDMLRSLPGITSKNYKHVMAHIESIQELVEQSEAALTRLLGSGPAKTLYNFLHEDSRRRT